MQYDCCQMEQYLALYHIDKLAQMYSIKVIEVFILFVSDSYV